MRTPIFRPALLLLLTFIALFSLPSPVAAQVDIEIPSSEGTSDFPNGLSFLLEVRGNNIEEVRLVYEIAPDGFPTTAEPECAGGALMTCSFQLAATRENALIPGAQATFFWRITAGGTTTETSPQTVTYEDDRFEWSTIRRGNLTLWWYAGSEDEAQRVLAAARESLDGASTLVGTDVTIPVKVFWYASAEDLAPAILPSDAEGVITAGEVVYSDTAMVSGNPADAAEVARHEVAHIVVRALTGGIYSVPDWLNEGLAVYMQSAPFPDQQFALEQAIRSGDVLSVRSLSSASSGGVAERVALFYGQSYSLVDFLVREYGEAKLTQLFRAFGEGATTAEALEQVYGFDQDGLENAWRASVGLPPRATPPPDTEAAPTDTPEPEPAPDIGADDDGVPGAVIIAIVALVVVLVGVFAAIGLLLARRYG